MAFHFVFAPLLRLRQSLERQQAMRLREASLAVARAQETLSSVEQLLKNSARADEALLRVGRIAVEVQFAALQRQRTEGLRQSCGDELTRLESHRQAVALAHEHAYQGRDVLDTLATQQRHTYQQEQLQREQRDLDASHLLQLWRKRHG